MTGPAVTSLGVEAPTGSHFASEEVNTARGTQSLGEHPLLVWDELEPAVAYYGLAELLGVLDGTSLRVSFQNIARRMALAGKTDDEIAQAQIDFRPGKRTPGVSTPQSRASSAAKKASEKVSGDIIATLLDKVARGEITEAELAGIVGGN